MRERQQNISNSDLDNRIRQAKPGFTEIQYQGMKNLENHHEREEIRILLKNIPRNSLEDETTNIHGCNSNIFKK